MIVSFQVARSVQSGDRFLQADFRGPNPVVETCRIASG